MSEKEGRIIFLLFAIGCGFVLGALCAEQYVTARLAPLSAQQRAYVEQIMQQKASCENALALLTSRDTVLYEQAPAGVDVLSGFAHIEAGRALDGTPLAPRQPKWVIPFAVKPQALNVPGAAYAWMDKQGHISALMEAQSVQH
jgi:hypothetical protein